jgi:oligoribonuclease NrnB/cAMP/cGMP phosphodiesterase (DHH superfamily)
MLDKNSIISRDVPSANISPKDIDGKDIIIMDVAYKYDVLRDIVIRAKSVIFIDHHITIKDDVKKLSDQYGDKIKIVYNEFESGASLTWKYLFKKQKLPLFIKYIKDNDIGEWKYKFTKQFIYALRVHYDIKETSEIIEQWNSLFDVKNVKSLIKLGKKYEQYAEYLLIESLRRYSLELFPSEKIYAKFSDYFMKPGQYKVAVFNNGCPNASLLGNRAVETIECDFAMIWSYNMEKKEYIISLRSNNADVGKIASAFGGGGHTFASAIALPSDKYNIQDLFFAESLPRK